MPKSQAYLNFNGNTEEAFNFYRSVFGGEFNGVVRFGDFPNMPGADQLSEADRRKIMHISLPIGPDSILMATDALESMGQKLNLGNNMYIYLEVDSAEEAERLFNALVEGGNSEMGLQKTEWAEKYGSLKDRFGVQWMLNYTGNVQYGAPAS